MRDTRDVQEAGRGARNARVPDEPGVTTTFQGSVDAARAGSAPPMSRLLRIVGRALARRCPNCGSGAIFRNYLQQRDTCPGCELKLDRGERDFFIGAYTINLIVAELLVVGGGLAVALATWPDVPWGALTWGLAALMVAAPIVLYPASRQLWLACDLIFRPAEDEDFATSQVT